jgi:predicted transposase/invertase (TIGR01784 family)
MYISEIRDVSLDRLKKALEESKIEGGDFMPSLAQRLRNEGKKQGREQNTKEIAMKMLNDNVPVESIIKYTGLTEKQIKELMH